MNLPLMSPAELDNAVYDLVARELGIANAMRFMARHNQPDGIDYTRDRQNWLPQEPAEIDRYFKNARAGFEKLVANSSRAKQKGNRRIERKKASSEK